MGDVGPGTGSSRLELAFENASSARDHLDELIQDPRVKENQHLRQKLEAVRKAVLVVMDNC